LVLISGKNLINNSICEATGKEQDPAGLNLAPKSPALAATFQARRNELFFGSGCRISSIGAKAGREFSGTKLEIGIVWQANLSYFKVLQLKK